MLTSIATIAGPILAVAIAVIGWALRPKREVHLKAADPTLINPEQRYSDYRLVVRYQDEDFIQPVFSSIITISNIGNRDISADDFVEPLHITIPTNHRIISSKYSAPEGVTLESGNNTSTMLNVRWNLLKPNQEIYLYNILTRDDENYTAAQSDDFKYVVLLKDVKTKFGSFRTPIPLRLGYYFLFIWVFTILIIFAITAIEYNRPTFQSPSGDIYVLSKLNEDVVRWCRPLDSLFQMEQCSSHRISSLSEFKFVETIPVRWRSVVPLSMSNWLAMILGPFILVLLDYRRQVSTGIRRLFSRG